MKTWRVFVNPLLVAALFFWAAHAPALEDDLCTKFEDKDIIEVIPTTGRTFKGNTCEYNNFVKFYTSDKCRLQEVAYLGGEVVYKLRLNKGNRVSFLLQPDVDNTPTQGDAKIDLVLALVENCGSGISCVSSSADFIGTKPEGIAEATYDPGIYYLYVDTWMEEGSKPECGPYTLSITGINPVPDLSVAMTARSPATPGRAVAGRPLTYELTVTNKGKAPASDVTATLHLDSFLDRTTLSANRDCTISGSSVSCELSNIPGGETRTLSITLNVDPIADMRVRSTADVQTDSGIGTHADLITPVDHVHDLSIGMIASPSEVIAGDPRIYTLTLHNAGPSDATKVVVTDTLDNDERFVLPLQPQNACDGDEEDCYETPDDGHVVCKIERIAAGSTASCSFQLTVKSSALSPVSNTAKIDSLTGSDPKQKRGNNQAKTGDVPVKRKTDLIVARMDTRREGQSQEQNKPIPTGAPFDYIVTVRNLGPSDSSGGTVKITLPADLQFVEEPTSGCKRDDTEVTNQNVLRVQCPIQRIAAEDKQSVMFKVKTSPGLRPTTLQGEASVAANEEDPGNNQLKFATEFKVEANLQINVADAGPDCASDNIVYTVTVSNPKGPSDSPGGTIIAKLVNASFVSSPNGCQGDDIIRCHVPPLKVGSEPYSIKFVTAPTADLTPPITIANTVEVFSANDPNSGNSSATVKTQVLPKVDLAITLSASPDLITVGEPLTRLTYNLTVTAEGASESGNVTVTLTPPEGSQPEPPSICQPVDHTGQTSCTLPFNITKPVTFLAPTGPGTVTAMAKIPVQDGARDCPENNVATATTNVVSEGEAVLSLSMKADREVVTEGDFLNYSISVVNRGFRPAENVTVVVTLPGGVKFDSGTKCTLDDTDSDTDPDTDPQIVKCCQEGVAANAPCMSALKVKIASNAERLFQSTAEISPPPNNDLNRDNNHKTVTTQRAASFVVPFFEVNEAGSYLGLTTIFSVRNPLGSVPVRYEYVPAGPEFDPTPVDLDSKATKTVNLRDSLRLEQLGGTAGYVGITPRLSKPGEPRPTLTGDFIRIDPSQGFASGERLISTDTTRKPRELCESWSVRFHHGLPAGSNTEFLFFIPGNSSTGVVATGKVFAESGAFVQNVEASLDHVAEAFRVPISSLDVLAGSGSIEWTFQNDLVGNVTAIHKLRGNDQVIVPGFCRTDQESGQSSLILPFFRLSPNVATTLLAVRNETDKELNIQISYFDVMGNEIPSEIPESQPPLPLAGHGTYTKDLRKAGIWKDPTKILEGFVKVNASSLSRALSGDYILADEKNGGLAGSALVDADPKRSPQQLCQKWDVRFVQDVLSHSTTSFLFYYHEGEGSPEGDVYSESGGFLGRVGVPAPSHRSFLVSVSNLKQIPPTFDLGQSGSIEWDLGKDNTGYVAMVFTGEGPDGKSYSVLIPGTCRDEPKPPGN